ncbi:hypothetical protein MNBD_GAMMA23-822 [hydrothermal vent metagenome]|uniref:VTT domain-containing protein n=1 Tax=hydrothermal vent metagenome TaxID=652676 RepID=A0A3B1A085_9ZZZZ
MKKYITGFLIVLLFSALYFYLWQSGDLALFVQLKTLQVKLQQIGYWGPLLIIVLMAGAIVMSPIPSAPIAIASGLVYGHSWGTLYVLIGAELGALIAFTVSRLLGYSYVQKKFGNTIVKYKFLHSENHLMVAVFVSRLIPFISFDIVSYAAGLTKISYFQFALATFAGILPASFLLAHFGGEMVNNDIQQMFITIFLLGFITLIPIVIGFIKKRQQVKRN